MLFYLSFYCSRSLLDLHSFPTRRSSDLSSRSAAPARWRSSLIRLTTSGIRWGASSTPGASKMRPSGSRSEEHTSELQSLRHLVCRLLLEKKKKKKRKYNIYVLYNTSINM